MAAFQPGVKQRIPEAAPKGGYLFADTAVRERQKKLVYEWLKGVGLNLVGMGPTSGEGVSLVSTQVPVGLFEPRSYTQRCTDWFIYAPHLLTRASKSDDPIERMRCVMITTLAGLHNTAQQAKPFNPILGETFQAEYADGSRVYVEQAAHHPPVTMWELIGPDNSYHMYGTGEVHTSFVVTSLKGYQHGSFSCDFPDGTHISMELPIMWVRGLLMGDRIVEWEGVMQFHDEDHGIHGWLQFNPDGQGGIMSSLAGSVMGMFSKQKEKLPTDHVRGFITRGRPYEPGKTAEEEIVSRLEGTVLGWFDWDGQTYWQINDPSMTTHAINVAEPLPSDAKFRPDLCAVAAGDLNAAQVRKQEGEVLQRQEAAQRKAGYKRDGIKREV